MRMGRGEVDLVRIVPLWVRKSRSNFSARGATVVRVESSKAAALDAHLQ